MARIARMTLDFPLGGYDEGWSRRRQPPRTTPSCLNVWPTDRCGRNRGAVRAGTRGVFDLETGRVQVMLQTTTQDEAGRQEWFVVVAGGKIFVGPAPDMLDYAAAGGPELAINGSVQAAAGPEGKIFFTDSEGTILLMDLLAADSSPMPFTAEYFDVAGVPPLSATLCCFWNNRLVLAGPGPVWYASRSGDPMNFDYAAQEDDVGRPLNGQAVNSLVPGGISDPLVALMPWRDDLLLLGGDRRIWSVEGDPADGGVILLRCPETGVLGPNAWCCDGRGLLWFVGHGGLYRYDGATPSLVSQGRVDQFFSGVDRDNTIISMAYDRQRQAVWVALSLLADNAAGTHLFHHLPTDSFWPIKFPDGFGPYSLFAYDGDQPGDRQLIMGSAVGAGYRLDDAAADDQGDEYPATYIKESDPPVLDAGGTPIEAWCDIGPIWPYQDEREAKLIGVRFILGEMPEAWLDQENTAADNWRMTYALKCGGDADEALEQIGAANPQYAAGAVALERRSPWSGHGLCGSCYFVRVGSNDRHKFWSLESVDLEFLQGGRV